MSDQPGPEATKAKRQILVGLSKALSALSDRMRSQGDAAAKLTLLAVRAEHIAQRSWDLNSVQGQHFKQECEALGREINDFAREVADAAKRAAEEALMGREVAQAITAHSEDIARLAREIDSLPDASAVRARLRPLFLTLTSLPERLKATAAIIKDVRGIAALASELAERGDRLAAGGMKAYREVPALCRDLRRFAEEATAVSLEMARGSALAVKAIDHLVEKTVGLSQGQPVSETPLTAHDRMSSLMRGTPPAGEVGVTTTPKRDQNQIPGSTVWGPPGKR